MNPSLASGVAAAGVLYLLSIVAVAVASRRRGSPADLGDFYLAGRSLGILVTVATLFATRYSGVIFLSVPAEVARIGLVGGVRNVGITIVMFIPLLLCGPILHHLAHRHSFVTPGDWITHRFGSPTLKLLANVVIVVATANYLLAQLMTMGHVAEGLSGGAVPYWSGVVVLTLLVIAYQTVGGMRAVAWTDCLQGGIMIVGVCGLLIVAVPTPAHFAELTVAVAETAPELIAVPQWADIRHWISLIVIMGLAHFSYPQVMQRIFAARDAATLKRVFCLLAVIAPVVAFAFLLLGMLAIHELPAIGDTDQVVPAMLAAWSTASTLHYLLAVLVITAIVAALMSTVDSLLLSLSSILAKDVVGPTLFKDASEQRLTRVGKLLSWIIISLLVVLALSPRVTLWGMLELQAEIVANVVPLFILGALWQRLAASAVLGGLLAGLATYAALLLAGMPTVWDMHAGLIALGVNTAVCVGLTLLRQAATSRRGGLYRSA